MTPANTKATVHLPVAEPAAVTESGRPATQMDGVRLLRNEGGQSRFEVGAGQCRLAMPILM
jgi:hypothetical protein